MNRLPYILLYMTLTLLPGTAVGQGGMKQVETRMTLEKVEAYWDPIGDTRAIEQKELREHGVSSHGGGGFFLKTFFDRHPLKASGPISVKFSFYIERDAAHPIYPVDGKNTKPIDWKYLIPLTFKVNAQNEIDISFGEEHDRLPDVTAYTVKRRNWNPFEIFIPWELFHLWNLHTEIKDLRANIFIRAEVFDSNGFKLGDNNKIPIWTYEREQGYQPDVQDLGTIDLSEDDCVDLVDMGVKLMGVPCNDCLNEMAKQYDFTLCQHKPAVRPLNIHEGISMEMDRVYSDGGCIHANVVGEFDLGTTQPLKKTPNAIEFRAFADKGFEHVCDLEQSLKNHGFRRLKGEGYGWASDEYYVNDRYKLQVVKRPNHQIVVIIQERYEADLDIVGSAMALLINKSNDNSRYPLLSRQVGDVEKEYGIGKCSHLRFPAWDLSDVNRNNSRHKYKDEHAIETYFSRCYEDDCVIYVELYGPEGFSIYKNGLPSTQQRISSVVYTLNRGFDHVASFPGHGFRKSKEFSRTDEKGQKYFVTNYTNGQFLVQKITYDNKNIRIIVAWESDAQKDFESDTESVPKEQETAKDKGTDEKRKESQVSQQAPALSNTLISSSFNSGSFEGWKVMGYNVDADKVVTIGGRSCVMLRTKGPGKSWDAMFYYDLKKSIKPQATYILSFKARSLSGKGKLKFTFSPLALKNFNIGKEWTTYTVSFNYDKKVSDLGKSLILSFGEVGDTYYIDDIVFGQAR